MAETGGRRMGFVAADDFRSETGIVSEPANVHGVVEGGISRRSERGRGVENEFGILFVSNNDASGARTGFGK